MNRAPTTDKTSFTFAQTQIPRVRTGPSSVHLCLEAQPTSGILCVCSLSHSSAAAESVALDMLDSRISCLRSTTILPWTMTQTRGPPAGSYTRRYESQAALVTVHSDFPVPCAVSIQICTVLYGREPRVRSRSFPVSQRPPPAALLSASTPTELNANLPWTARRHRARCRDLTGAAPPRHDASLSNARACLSRKTRGVDQTASIRSSRQANEIGTCGTCVLLSGPKRLFDPCSMLSRCDG